PCAVPMSPPSPSSCGTSRPRSRRRTASRPWIPPGGHDDQHPVPSAQPAAEAGRDTLRVTPLGGLGDVGRNMAVLEFEGRLLVIDCGVLFPEDAQPGVDLILPDFEQISDRLDDIAAIVLTHGHEDHIGAVPY